ncbi:MAG: type I secretion system permease/ATPase [Hyphomicrobiaceae bacterium]|nr:type I secretion system permease/ATPase [Hyphomicrobiaceae bacterium]
MPDRLLRRLPGQGGELLQAVLASWPSFRAIAWFSFASNILMLAGPLFMLQVYDRVLTSGSMPTLVALSLLTAAIYGIIGLLDMVRSRVIVRVGVELDRRISTRVFAATLKRSITSQATTTSALRELDQLRQFISGQGPITACDAPWTPVYLLVIFLTHWTLGVVATLGAAVLVVIAWASEIRSRGPLIEAGKAGARSLELAESGQRNAESISAMSMQAAYRARWQKTNGEAIAWQVLAADRLASMTSLSKTLRLLLQSLMLAVGAALAIKGEISAGAIIAGTIIFGRALAPVEQAVGQWRSFVRARESFAKLDALLREHPDPTRRTSLPAPKGRLQASSLRVVAPETREPILAGISFSVEPGQMLAIIGPSASGKSTLARAIVGLWPLAGGEIRLDGARLDQWNADELGRHIGYLPQSVELFAGTVRENISRFEPDASDDAVVEAARAAHAHDMILALPKGYETQLGSFGAYLSAGQRQRIGLARALFGRPALIVLDEPNANLDRTGDEALAAAVDGMRACGQAIVLVSHRVQAIGKADLLVYLDRGQQRAFGPRDEVLRFIQQGNTPRPQAVQQAAAGGKAAR